MNCFCYKRNNESLEELIYKLELLKNNIPILFCNVSFSVRGIDIRRKSQNLSGDYEHAANRMVGAIACCIIDFNLFDKANAIAHWMVKIIEWRNKLLNNVSDNDEKETAMRNEIFHKISSKIKSKNEGYREINKRLKDFFSYEINNHYNNPKYSKFIDSIKNYKLSEQDRTLIMESVLAVMKSIILYSNGNLIKTLKNVFGPWIFDKKYTKNIDLMNVINKLKI